MSTTQRELVLGPELAGTLMTPEEFDAVEEYDDLYRYELIHGVLVVNPIPLAQETGPNELLGHLLLVYKDNHPQGSSLDQTLPEQYVRTRDSRRRADRLIWTGLGRVPKLKRDLPSIVVEFVSAAKRDRHRDYVEKREEYMALGIREYWIIDRSRRQMTVYIGQPDGVREQIVAETDNYRTDLLPGFELPLARILASADMWRQQE